MRIAIFHNFMDNIGGAEIVTLVLARELHADIYSTVANQENIRRMGFETKVRTIGWIPRNAPWRQQLASLRFRLLNLSESYDFFIIAGDWALSGAVKNKPNLWYVHSPTREFYDMYEYVREHIVPGRISGAYAKYIFDLWVYINRTLNARYVDHVDTLVANSENVRQRVKTYLGKEADVIHPPTETARYHYGSDGRYWLSVNRLISPKRIELQLDAFAKLPHEKLTIVGSYEQAEHFLSYKLFLEERTPDNVTLLSHVAFDELVELYAHCRGFITTARDEDFGMTAVEAMASGKAVIAPNEGGYRETVINGKTGILIDDIDAGKLAKAIREVGKNPERYKADCQARAQKFDTSVFIDKIRRKIGT